MQELKRDFAALRARLDQIPEEREKEIAVIERHYSNPRSLTFPAAVLFLVPERKEWGVGSESERSERSESERSESERSESERSGGGREGGVQ